MATLAEFLYTMATKHIERPRKDEDAEAEAEVKMMFFEHRFLLEMAKKAAVDAEGEKEDWRKKPRAQWSAHDLLESWRDDAAVCKALPHQEVMHPVRGFRRSPFTIDTVYRGRLDTFTFEALQRNEKDFIRVTCNKRTYAEFVDEEKDLAKLVGQRSSLIDVIEDVLWPFLNRLD